MHALALVPPTAGYTALQALGDSIGALTGQDGSGPSALGDFWNLVEQAGPLRWPIFAVLAVGLVLVIGKLYELLRDRSASQSLFGIDFRPMSLTQITTAVSRQGESMLASLQSAMLNVFHTRPTEGMLHDEIANFVSFQQDQFAGFRRRMDFLSDTAGALGLMGTVWGMFVVFFQGTSDKDVILRGMGIALITTLLGLVVSIILNLSATELSTYFGKRLALVSKKSDELRFRLLELAPATTGAPPAAERRQPEPAVRKVLPSPPEVSKSAARPIPQESAPARAAPSWCYVDAESPGYVAEAGETVRDVGLIVRRMDGEPAERAIVVVSLPPGAGTVEGEDRELRRETDDAGALKFRWTAPEQSGTFSFEAAVAGQPGSSRHVDLRVTAAKPHRVEHEGNHQAAVAGMRLPKPLGVRVYDRFDNPVPGIAVTFQIRSGKGSLGQDGTEVTRETDTDGMATTVFAVSSDAGPNIVAASLNGADKSLEFVAFGTEV